MTSGGAVSDEGATTIFFGANSIGVDGANIASDIDYFNDNETDLGFVKGVDLGDIQRTIFANADIALHEAGHTYGLHHVFSGDFPETMGYTYSTRSYATTDTGFLNLPFSEFIDENGADHSGGLGAIGPQNSFQRVAQSFGFVPLDRSGAEPSVFGNGNLNALSDAGLFEHFGHEHGLSETSVSQNDEPSHGPNCGCDLCQISRPAMETESKSVQPLAVNSDLASFAVQEQGHSNATTGPIVVIPRDEMSLAGHTLEVDEPIFLAGFESSNGCRFQLDLTPSSLDQAFENFDEFELAELV